MAPSVTRIVGSLVPGRPLPLARGAGGPPPPDPRLAFCPTPWCSATPCIPAPKHYLLIPTGYSPSILDLPAPAAQRLQEDIREWVSTTGWRFVTVVVNFGAYQETPFLHIHLLQSATAPAGTAPPALVWLSVELEDGEVESGRRVVHYDAVRNTAEVTTEVNRS